MSSEPCPNNRDRDLFHPPPYCRKAAKIDKPQNEETSNETSTPKLLVSNTGRLLLLCESLIDTTSKAIEVKINKYVSI